MSGKPKLLVHPPLPGFEQQELSEFELVHADDPPEGVAVAVSVGTVGIPRPIVERFTDLKVVVGLGVGTEGIDVAYLQQRGIQVTRGRDINDEDVADVAIGLLIGVIRRFTLGASVIAAGSWAKPISVPLSPRIRGLKLGIVGLGAIGRAVAARAAALGMDIAWTGPRPKPDASYCYEPSLLKLAQQSDALVLAAPGGPSTHKIINAEIIDALGAKGVLVNVARGSLVDEDALIAALREGRLYGAGLDVYAEEPTPPEKWRDLPNAVLTPHLAGATFAGVAAIAENARENVRRYYAGQPLLSPV